MLIHRDDKRQRGCPATPTAMGALFLTWDTRFILVVLAVLIASCTAAAQSPAAAAAGEVRRSPSVDAAGQVPPDLRTGERQSDDAKERPVLTNMNLGVHSIMLNPKFVDLEANGSIRFWGRVDSGGFFSLVPRTFGVGGSHYGEFTTTFRLIEAGRFMIGPAHEHVAVSFYRDQEKLGIAGKLNVKSAFFNFEMFPYATRGNEGNVGVFYSIPLLEGWKAHGFVDYLAFRAKPPVNLVAKINLTRRLPAGFEFIIEYFHTDFAHGAERDRLGAGFAYKVK